MHCSSRFLAALFLVLSSALLGDVQWAPIPPEELAFKEVPGVPGAQAAILYLREHTDDMKGEFTEHVRIKILTEEGRKYGNVEIPFWKGQVKLEEVQARTVQPDGASAPFSGELFEKTLAQSRKVKMLAKTFTLPNVRVGSIIEYRYRLRWNSEWLLPTTWQLQRDLFVRDARFSLLPNSEYRTIGLKWYAIAARADVQPQMAGGQQVLEWKNQPPFIREEYVPPEREIRPKLLFYYRAFQLYPFGESRPAYFSAARNRWEEYGVLWSQSVEKFLDKPKAMAAAVSGLVSPGDSAEAKLCKIYKAVQPVVVPRSRTAAEVKREPKTNKNVEDVWKNQGGTGQEINLLFVGLARAAGFNASLINYVPRDRAFFHNSLEDPSQFAGTVVEVRLKHSEQLTQNLYYDPATALLPCGQLDWDATGVNGIRLGKADVRVIEVPSSPNSDAVMHRKASLEVDRTGRAKGTIEVDFEGQDALRRRVDGAEEDEAARKKQFEDEVKAWLPQGSTVTLVKATGWTELDKPLHAEFSVEIPTAAAATGRRLLISATPFVTPMYRAFRSPDRQYPIYFRTPFKENDDIVWKLPEELALEDAPKNASQQLGTTSKYELTVQGEARQISVRRRLILDGVLYQRRDYPGLKNFFELARGSDESQIVARTATPEKP